MSIVNKFAEVKYEWQHAPKKQRSGLIVCGIAIVAIVCIWQVLAVVQANTLDQKGGTPFGEAASSQSDKPSNESDGDMPQGTEQPSAPSENSSATADKEPSKNKPIDVSVVEVSAHTETGVRIDRLPAVAAPFAPALEKQLQSLLDSRLSGLPGAKAYLDTSKGISLTDGESAQVTFSVVVEDGAGKNALEAALSFSPSTHNFGIVEVLMPTTPPPA